MPANRHEKPWQVIKNIVSQQEKTEELITLFFLGIRFCKQAHAPDDSSQEEIRF